MRNRILITSALPYINGTKHLGNLVGSMLPADVYARFMRQHGAEVLYICATDEHGTPAEIAAFESNKDVKTYCDELHELQKKTYARYGLSFDYFGRSSSKENRELTQHFYEKIKQHGYISQKNIKAVYSVDDQRYLPDRYVSGTCPNCGSENARGDQCETCGKLLDPTDLINPRSTLTGGRQIEVRDSKHLFLELPKLEKALHDWIDAKTDWPKLTTSIAHKWLHEGLQDRCITRDLKWGVSVPEFGFEDKVFYVWFDAPIEYLGATKEFSPDWKKWWQGGSDVHYVQFMAKDNVPFHTIMWPAMVMATGENWKQADYIKSVNWLTYYGDKFSTSRKYGIFTDAAIELYPADYWRWALMAMIPEPDDSSFTWEFFQGFVNTDLANNFGNFINRTLKFIASKMEPKVPGGNAYGEREKKLEADLQKLAGQFNAEMNGLEFRKAVASLRAIWSLGNLYIDERGPWTLMKTDEAAAKTALRACVNLVRIYAVLAEPFIPFASAKVYAALRLSEAEKRVENLSLDALEEGREFDLPEILFARIANEDVTALKAKFGSR